MEGAGLVFDASDNVTAGTITRMDIDLNSDQGAINGGDINISGLNITATADLAAHRQQCLQPVRHRAAGQ